MGGFVLGGPVGQVNGIYGGGEGGAYYRYVPNKWIGLQGRLNYQYLVEDSGNWNSQNPRVHIPQEKSWTVCGIEVSAAGDASRSNNDNTSNGFTFEFDNFYLKYEDNNADEDYVYVLNGEVSEVNDDTININGESFDIRWSIDLPD